MGYYIDLSKITLAEYQEMLKNDDLLPSQMVLRERLDDYFGLLKSHHLETVEDIRKALNSKTKLADFSQKSGIPEAYLKILIRNINGFRQSPNKISDFPEISEDVVEQLASLGIKDTRQLYDRALTSESRSELSIQTDIGEEELLRLARLADLCRIRWVNHTFAYMLLETGYDSVKSVALADHQQVYESIKTLNEERTIFKGNIGLHDMKLCVEAANRLSFEIEYPEY
jgi:hypothetical protein